MFGELYAHHKGLCRDEHQTSKLPLLYDPLIIEHGDLYPFPRSLIRVTKLWAIITKACGV